MGLSSSKSTNVTSSMRDAASGMLVLKRRLLDAMRCFVGAKFVVDMVGCVLDEGQGGSVFQKPIARSQAPTTWSVPKCRVSSGPRSLSLLALFKFTFQSNIQKEKCTRVTFNHFLSLFSTYNNPF